MKEYRRRGDKRQKKTRKERKKEETPLIKGTSRQLGLTWCFVQNSVRLQPCMGSPKSGTNGVKGVGPMTCILAHAQDAWKMVFRTGLVI
jgi:hypothetical protein